MIRIAIVEDDPQHLHALVTHIRRYEADKSIVFDIASFEDGSFLVADYQPIYDIIMLDIETPRLDGMTAARLIREVDKSVVLLFVTASPQYAVSGYEVSAMSYLLKPVPFFALSRELDRGLDLIGRRERRFVVVVDAGDRHRVDLTEVLFFESVRHRLIVHEASRTLTTTGSLKAMEEEVAEFGFFRCNAPYLVNLRHVTAVRQGTCELTDGRLLPVSRPRRKDFLAALSGYVSGAG